MGILSDAERKSAEPLAARACVDPSRADAEHQRLLYFLADSKWDDEAVRQESARYGLASMTAHDPIQAWTLDDTGFLKQGKHSVGVQRQYTGSQVDGLTSDKYQSLKTLEAPAKTSKANSASTISRAGDFRVGTTTPGFRKQGIGKALHIELAPIAVREHCAHFQWQVLDWNTPAIEFYQSLDARLEKELLTMRFTDEALRKLPGLDLQGDAQ